MIEAVEIWCPEFNYYNNGVDRAVKVLEARAEVLRNRIKRNRQNRGRNKRL